MNLKEIKEIIKLMDENSLAEFELEREGEKIVLKKERAFSQEVVPVQQTISVPAKPAQSATPEEKKTAKNLKEIASPMVGTFYRAPSPESPSYVDKGQEVKEDDTVCIVEAMKVMNEIKAELRGTIVDILVENGHPVEYGQVLFLVE